MGNLGSLGLNFGVSRDDDSFVLPFTAPQKTDVVSLDVRLSPIKDLNLEGEFATSRFDKNTDSKEIDKKTDQALYFVCDYRMGRFYLRQGFSRYGSNFSSVSGYTTQDLEEYFQETEIDLLKDTRLRLSYRANRDNLDKHKPTTTFQKSPAVNLSLQPFKNTDVDLGYSATRRDAVDDSVEETTHSSFLRIRQGIGQATLSLEYRNTRIDDNIDSSRQKLTDSVLLNFDTSFSLKDINCSPSLEYEITHDEYRYILESDLTQNYGLGLRLTFPKDWEINSKMRVSDFNSYQPDTDQLTCRYEFSILKRFSQNYEFSLNYEYSDYDYEISEENYNETLLSARLNLRF